MKNPTKVHFTTLGGRDYVFKDKAKEDVIEAHDNTMKKLRNDYKKLLPQPPQMSNDLPSPNTFKKQLGIGGIERNDSFVTLGDENATGRSNKRLHGRNASFS